METTLTTDKNNFFCGGQLGTRFARRVRFPTGCEPPQGAVTPAGSGAPRGFAARKRMLFLQVVFVVSNKTYRQERVEGESGIICSK